MALVHAGSGQPSARYEYAPFGEPLRVTGDAALLNPFRFSTKYTDDETGLLYYGYRYYSPTLAKWLNRDPLGEEGGLNLYAFVANNPITGIDALGLSLLTLNPGLEQDGRAQEMRTGASFTSRVKDAVEGFNDFQDLASIAMDLFDGVAGDDMLLDMLQRGQQNLAGGLRKGEGHHSIPKFLGGEQAQNLIGLAPSIHDDFHRDLHSRLKGDGLLGGLGGKKNGRDAWDMLLKGSSREQKAGIFKHLLKSSLEIDTKHGGNGALTMSVLGNFLGGRGGHFRLP